ncbi:MAG TPA: hypothetical protein VK841_09280 [Polyangiaceae bacterium]|jgi:hypothetical protein|nr:hypothetical protein [Polyangiaceae bacterium]
MEMVDAARSDKHPTERMTLAQWAAVPADEREFVDGDLLDEEVPEYVHEFIVM